MQNALVIIVYMLIGGFIASNAAVSLEKDCNQKMTVSEYSLASATWPALISGAIVIHVRGAAKECRK